MIIPLLVLGTIIAAITYRSVGGKKGWDEQARELPPGTLRKGVIQNRISGSELRAPKFISGGYGHRRSLSPLDIGQEEVTTSLVARSPSNQAELRPLPPELYRLLSYLVLFARDKVNRAGEKKFLSYGAAKEAVMLAKKYGLQKTARAIMADDPVPDNEYLPGRTVSVRQSVVSYGTTGKA